VRHLRRRFECEDQLVRHAHQFELIEGPVEGLPGESVYDYIISGLPLNNFAPGQVRAIFRTFVRLLKPGGTMTYFEYAFVRHLKTPFVSRNERRRLFSVGRVVNRYIRDFQVRKKRVLVNVPPATVRHLRFKPAAQPLPAARAVPELTS
jgi:phospholipid N-methyltransferase